jgi:LCP family protein required for cell wall assembly
MSDAPRHAPVPRPHGRLARVFVAVSASLALFLAAGSAYGLVQYVAANRNDHPIIFDPTGASGSQAPIGPCIDDVCNYLLLGSDSRAGLTPAQQAVSGTNADIGGSNRADTIIVVHTDPKLQKAIILSFPRDLWVDIPGHGPDKINAAFEGGVDGNGPKQMAATINQLTGLTINHVLYVDLAGFQGVVDTLGGVEMCIPAENVNTPGYVEAEEGSIYYGEKGHIVDPRTGLDVLPGCQTLSGDQALAFVRTRHLRCDSAAPDFYRISRQQQFLRAVINRLLQPAELAKLPGQIQPIMDNLRKDDKLDIADLVYLVGQLRGISTGAAEFRSVPAYPITTSGGLDALKMDPSANQIFRAIREGKPIGDVGLTPQYTPPSPANIVVPVVDHASEGKAAAVEQILADSGFDIAPGVVLYADYGANVAGNVIAYQPGHEVDAKVVQQYFPDLPIKEVKGLTDPVAVFVTASYEPAQVGIGGTPVVPPDCLGPTG